MSNQIVGNVFWNQSNTTNDFWHYHGINHYYVTDLYHGTALTGGLEM